jgi:hypothetical protein
MTRSCIFTTTLSDFQSSHFKLQENSTLPLADYDFSTQFNYDPDPLLMLNNACQYSAIVGAYALHIFNKTKLTWTASLENFGIEN